MNPSARGKVLLHGRGADALTEKDLDRRARELATINGRPPGVVTDDDLAQARRELTGEDLPATVSEDSKVRGALTRDPSDPPSDFGHQTPDREGSDEQSDPERLVEEGVEEAQHDQMLAARRREHRQDQGKE